MSEEPNIVLNVASQLSYLLCCFISQYNEWGAEHCAERS